MDTARKRFASAKSAWAKIREDYALDMKFVNVRGGQWEPDVADARAEDELPVLEFNELGTYVQQISNRARQERPQPKVEPGDDGKPETAEVLEDKLRHCWYASQGDVACDNAVEGSAGGGFGFYRITREYVGDRSFHQEPRVRRILDHTTVYFDPAVQEPDFSDAGWCFVRKRMKRDDYSAEFGKDPVPFGEGSYADWEDEENIWVAEYWHVEKRKSTLVQLEDGSMKFKDELAEGEAEQIAAERPVIERTVYCDIIDGHQKLEGDVWPGEWIGIIPVLGKQVIVEGEMHLISAVRFALDAQKLKNSIKSRIAELLGMANDAPYIGWKGQFKDSKWRNGKRNYYLEAEPLNVNGQPASLPQRNQVEPPIQALSAAALQYSDDIKRAVGYVDNVPKPSQSGNLSGVAVERREQQQDLTNSHFEDNLVRSQWHAGRVMLDLLLNLTDTPRVWNARKEDGSIYTVPVTMQLEDGTLQYVPGCDPTKHHQIDLGSYDVIITGGQPSYDTRNAESLDKLVQILQGDPALVPGFLDLIFKKLGYQDLQERAELLAPPAVQQSLHQGQGQGIPPQVQAQMAQLQQRLQQMQQALQKMLLERQGKIIEQQGRLHLERVQTAGKVMLEDMKQRHDTQEGRIQNEMDMVKHLMDLLHQVELAPDPNAAPPGAQPGAQPQPQG